MGILSGRRVHGVSIGRMEKRMGTTILGLGFRVYGV